MTTPTKKLAHRAAGFGERKRGNVRTWRYQYRNPDGRVRELTIGRDSRQRGLLAMAIGAMTLPPRFASDQFIALMRSSRGAKEEMPRDVALAIAAGLAALVEQGKDPVELIGLRKAKGERQAVQRVAEQQRGERSLEVIGARWIDHLRVTGRRSAELVRRELELHVYPLLGTKDVGDIGKGDAWAVHDRLATQGKAATALRVVRLLRALLSFAVERDLIETNKLLGMKRLPKVAPRERVLIKFPHDEDGEPDPAELMAIWRAADTLDEPRRSFARMLILTGQRLGKGHNGHGEVARMRWADVDLKTGVWAIGREDHKGGRGHTVPLSRQALELIEALPRVSEYVFAGGNGRPIGDFTRFKAKLDQASGVADWQLHDLRRTAASWIEERFGLEVMHAVLGHSLGSKLAQTYARGPGFTRKRQALQQWADWLLGEPAKVVQLRA